MVFYFERKEGEYFIFFDENNKKYEMLSNSINIISFKKPILEGDVFITEDYKIFNYDDGLTKKRKKDIMNLQKKVFGI